MRHCVKAQFHFFDKQNVAISMRIDPTPEQRDFVQLFFLSNFIIRHLSNMGHGTTSAQIETRFRTLLTQHCDDFATCPLEINVSPLTTKPASQQLSASLNFDLDKSESQLTLNYAGFGFFQRRYGEYAPVACLSIARFLSQQRANDLGFCRRVLIAAAESARQFSSGQVTLTNHSFIAINVALSVTAIDVGWPTNAENTCE